MSDNTASPDRDFVISRVFDAPRELVFTAWTDAKLLSRWWGPKTFTNPICELDPRAGGNYRITMRAPDGENYPMRGTIIEVLPPEKIVMTMDCTEHPPEWHDMVKPNRTRDQTNPAGIMLTTVTFDDAGPGRTKLTVRVRLATPEIRDAMIKMGMTEGWSSSLDRLGELLANTSM